MRLSKERNPGLGVVLYILDSPKSEKENHPHRTVLLFFFYLLYRRYLFLVLFTQQVVDRLHRVERRKWNLHKHRVPVAHGSVP